MKGWCTLDSKKVNVITKNKLPQNEKMGKVRWGRFRETKSAYKEVGVNGWIKRTYVCQPWQWITCLPSQSGHFNPNHNVSVFLNKARIQAKQAILVAPQPWLVLSPWNIIQISFSQVVCNGFGVRTLITWRDQKVHLCVVPETSCVTTPSEYWGGELLVYQTAPETPFHTFVTSELEELCPKSWELLH